MRLIPSTLLAAGLIAALAIPADASRRDPRYGYVTAYSRYGSGTVTAPVRQGPAGRLEVRLPGGTWIECGRSCRDTLRRETVDFWKSREIPGGDGVGYIRFFF